MERTKQVKKLIRNGIDKKSKISLLFHNNDKSYIIYLIDDNVVLEYFFHNNSWVFNVHTYNWYETTHPNHSFSLRRTHAEH
jgi:hypothetical protein